MIRTSVFIVWIFLTLGCSPLAQENTSISVDIHPVRYEMSLMLDRSSKAAAELEWQEFKRLHQQSLLTQGLTFSYTNAAGKKTAERWRNRLMLDGAEQDNVSLKQAHDLGPFDLRVELLTYKSVTPLCQPKRITNYHQAPIGCAVNGNLWQAMAEPQDALSQSKQPQD